jgi:hypothetical protein
MPEAPRRRPDEHTVLRAFHGHVKARPGAVFHALAKRLRPESRARAAFVADEVSSLVVVQGTWWYRCEVRVVPDDTGSRVEQTIVDVARRAKWAASLVARPTLSAAPTAFQRLVTGLRQELE